MREIHNVQEGLGHAPASTPVDVQCLHRLYNGLANALLHDLATPAALQNQPPPLNSAIVRDIAPDDLRSYHPGHEGVSGDGHRYHEAGVPLDNLDSAQGGVAKRCDGIGNH
ncbi:hypothetical protein M438DRAFT_344185 [Aureobasidium pullulans EXF-150]|uniref:Uncharacterized protein n=1 Tax=Aureobasidium pullulans EXF-150 TaxID=1043002 RepID=A0A074XUW5_AURPU|nr:uncharacterized protein M438DRAFT_344185 [Aureobasidium pullulans EXF-150]KEQ85732.1 hypothetical protein M438DRAFT_344185 [Aureobasidium pullulans EXF-150]